MSRRKFAHNARLDYSKGKLRVHCCCGKQSPVFEDTEDHPLNRGKESLFVSREEQADEWFLNHTGVREIQPRRRERDGS